MPASPETVLRESLHRGVTFTLPIVRLLELDGRNIADGPEQATIVEPIDPLQDGVFDRLGASPRSSWMNDLGLEQADDRLCERVVVGIASRSDRGVDCDR